MRVWIDDLRDPADYGYPDAIWLKNEAEYIVFLAECLMDDLVDDISDIHFDNDLGEVREGYDIFVSLEEDLFNGNFKGLRNIYVHTSNPSAAQKFMLARESLLWYGIDLIRKNY